MFPAPRSTLHYDPGSTPLRRQQRRMTAAGDSSVLSLRPDTADLTPGQMLPDTRYRLLNSRGEGAVGVVYEAEHVDIERRCAIKILRAHLSPDAQIGRTFREEARTATRIGSPYIIEIYDFGELGDGRQWFAMELLDGRSVADELDERGAMEVSRAVGILRQVCKGLAAAHDAGVVHRDVKPDNIVLVQEDGHSDSVNCRRFQSSRTYSPRGRASAIERRRGASEVSWAAT